MKLTLRLYGALIVLASGAAHAELQKAGVLPEVASNAAPTATIGGTGAQVTAGSTDSNVSLKLSYQASELPLFNNPGTVRNGASFTTFSLTATAPLDKGQDSQTLFSNGGLGKANSLALTAFHYMTNFRNPTAQDTADLYKLCDQMRAKAQVGRVGVAAVKPDDAAKLECAKSSFAKYDPEDLSDAELLRAGPVSGGWGIGITGKAGQNNATFYDGSTLAKNTMQSKPWSVGAIVSYLFPSNESMISLAGDRRRVYKDQDTSTRCPASSTTTPVQCVTGSFGAPTGSTSSVVTLEGRTLLPRDMAISLSIARDLTKKVTAVEMPIYLTKNVAGALTGGVKVNWDNDKKKTTLGVFVGAPFTIWQ